jgi:ABC-type Fe3+-hydroxamate transport system substrate-binding protein
VELELKKLRLAYKVVSTKTLDEIGASALIIAENLGDKKTGTAFYSDWKAALRRYPETTFAKNAARHPTAVVTLQHDPIFLAASGTYLNEMLNRCGAENSFAANSGHIKVSLESVIQKAPQFILVVGHFSTAATKADALRFWKKYVPRAEVIVLDELLVGRPGPRLIQGLTQMCDALREKHP